MKQKISTILCGIFLTFLVKAQEEGDFHPPEVEQPTMSAPDRQDKLPSKWDRFHVGGGLGLAFGNQWFVDISPVIKYQLTESDKWYVGVGYSYTSAGTPYERLSSSAGRLFTQYYIRQDILLHGEYENYFSVQYKNLQNGFEDRIGNVEGILVGGGINAAITSKVAAYMLILFNLTHDPVYTPHTNPVIRVVWNVNLQ